MHAGLTDCSETLGVDRARQGDSVTVGQIGVGGGDSEDDAGGVADVGHDEALKLVCDVIWLALDRDAGHSR